MPAALRCPHCQTPYRLPEGHAGATVRCPKCGQLIPPRKSAEAGAPPRAPGKPAAAPRQTRPPSPPPPAQPASRPGPGPATKAGCSLVLVIGLLLGGVTLGAVVLGGAVVVAVVYSRQGPTPSAQGLAAAGNPVTTTEGPGNGAKETTPVAPRGAAAEGGEKGVGPAPPPGGATEGGGKEPVSLPPRGAAPADGGKPKSPLPTGGSGVPAPGEKAKLPGTVEVPSFLVTANTRQVYRVHLSGLQPSAATMLTRSLRPVIARLPAENPLRKAVLQMTDVAGFQEDYRSVRSKLLAAGVDTVYFVAEDDWTTQPELPGTIAIPCTEQTCKRLVERLHAAGHDDLADFLNGFHAAGPEGWVVRGQGAPEKAGASDAKRRLVEYALKESFPLRPASLTPLAASQGPVGAAGGAYHLDLAQTWPLTVVNLEPTRADQVLGVLAAGLFPRMTTLLASAQSSTTAVSVVPSLQFRQVAHMGNDQAARQLAGEITGTRERVVEGAIGDSEGNPLIEMFKLMANSTIQASARGNDVLILMQSPNLLGMDVTGAAQRTLAEMEDEDWTVLPSPAGHHWDLSAEAGKEVRYDVIDRVAAVRVLGGPGQPAAPEALPGERWGRARFRVPLDGGGALEVSSDRRGHLTVGAPGQGNRQRPPSLELLGDRGERLLVVRLDLGPGDPRFDLVRTRNALQEGMKRKRETEKQAAKDLDDAENEQQKELNAATPVQRGEATLKWGAIIKAKQTALNKETRAVLLMADLERKVIEAQRRFPAMTLVKDGEPAGAGVNPLAAQREKLRFAGRWVLDNGVLLTLHQDTKGLVAGTLSAAKVGQVPPRMFGKDANAPPPPPSQRSAIQEMTTQAILSGKVDGQTLTYTWMDTGGKEAKGKVVLGEDGLSGTVSEGSPARPDEPRPPAFNPLTGTNPLPRRNLMGGLNGPEEPPFKGGAYRVDTGLPDPAWFQGDPGDFEGYWVHASQKTENTTLTRKQPGLFEGAGGSGPALGGNKLKAVAAGNVMFFIQSPGYFGSKVREALLSADGQKLTLDPAPPGARPAAFGGPIELTRGK